MIRLKAEGQRKGLRSATPAKLMAGMLEERPEGSALEERRKKVEDRRLPVFHRPLSIACYCRGQVAMLRRVKRTDRLLRGPRLWKLILF